MVNDGIPGQPQHIYHGAARGTLRSLTVPRRLEDSQPREATREQFGTREHILAEV